MLKVGIVGLPNVGKSTLFKALTRKEVDISNYPFCTIDPNVGVVEVPDERLDKLAEVLKSPRKIPAVIEFIDIAGLVKGAHKGEGLGNKFLSHIREVDAIVEVVRFFEDSNISHVEETIRPLRDIEIIESELILADLETISRRLEKLEREIKAQKKEALRESEILKTIQESLEKGGLASRFLEDPEAKKILQGLFLLTAKPFLYVFNYSQQKPDLPPKLEEKNHLFLDLKEEAEISELTPEELRDLGLKPELNELIKKAFQLLNLVIFYTFNEKEIRAWEIPEGTKAPQAGGKIHSDFEEKFVRAEVIQWDKLLESGSWQKAREKGELRIEGKDYPVRDGDVIYFLI